MLGVITPVLRHCLRTSAMRAAIGLGCSLPSLSISRGHMRLKNSAGQPSGPGALLLARPSIAFCTFQSESTASSLKSCRISDGTRLPSRRRASISAWRACSMSLCSCREAFSARLRLKMAPCAPKKRLASLNIPFMVECIRPGPLRRCT